MKGSTSSSASFSTNTSSGAPSLLSTSSTSTTPNAPTSNDSSTATDTNSENSSTTTGMDISNGPPIATSSPDSSGGRSKSSKNTKPIIIGSVVGGTILILLVLLLIYLHCRRRSGPLRNTNSMGPDVFYRDKMVQAIGRRLSLNVHQSEYAMEERINSSSTTPLREDLDGSHDQEFSTECGTSVGILGGDIVESSDSIQTGNLSRARTDRQMQIEQKILDLQSQLIKASASEREHLRGRIEKLKDLEDSPWAYEKDGDELPEIMKEYPLFPSIVTTPQPFSSTWFHEYESYVPNGHRKIIIATAKHHVSMQKRDGSNDSDDDDDGGNDSGDDENGNENKNGGDGRGERGGNGKNRQNGSSQAQGSPSTSPTVRTSTTGGDSNTTSSTPVQTTSKPTSTPTSLQVFD
ncbi:hypothetical protein L218DRAFT_998770 [Marasmius fiardii PR-910]|nr:hypothetical protein L218DRAFT_998770 [Marasmius fiardii PR-910]